MGIKIGGHKSHIIAFSCGLAAHVLIWFIMFGLNVRRLCDESECWSLILLDAPMSFLYSKSNYSVTYGSLFLGSIWWGGLWFFSYSLFLYMKSAIKAVLHRE